MEFQLSNGDSFIKFTLLKFFDDSNDYEFCVDIRCGCFSVSKKTIYANKNDFRLFYDSLQESYRNLIGGVTSHFEYDTDILLKISFTTSGHLNIYCDVKDGPTYGNKLHLEFETDQSYIKQTLQEIKLIINEY